MSIWCASLLVMVALPFGGRWPAIPFHEYMEAGRRWTLHRPLYNLRNIDGFQYFPQSALFFSLIARLGLPLGDLLWRTAGWALYAFGLWRLVKHLLPTEARRGFLVATLLALGPAIGNLNNGQANLLLGALAAHITVDLIEEHRWRAALLLAFGFALKPLMGVLLLLVWALYGPMRWRVAVTVACAAAAPWLFRDHAYVVAQYRDCFVKLGLCANPDRQFEDIRGLLTALGIVLPQSAYLVIRAVAAIACLCVCLRARLTLREPIATFLVTSFALIYLALFNPRTLGTSYAMPGAMCALLGARHLLLGNERRAALTLVISLAWTLNYHEVPFVKSWLRPLAGLAFLGLLVHELIRDKGLAVVHRLAYPR